ncbi:rho GDP-dissociation inhibitor 1-like [Camellia sinensis]|uniref:rho GDP-dissociation inhibitor 1-like n=1 Tax=Camellia sinensis TaxID=4442 RepID=UPI001036742F|nr:rho GDP-dissociation inhibitor 1-like [Camellia sinensis]
MGFGCFPSSESDQICGESTAAAGCSGRLVSPRVAGPLVGEELDARLILRLAAVAGSSNNGFNVTSETKPTQTIQSHSRQPSETSCYATEDEEEGNKEDEEEEARLQLGPICSIKEHLEKDKDDESLRRWKEQLFGSVDVNAVEETLEPNVKILSLTALCPGRSDLVFEIPANEDPKGVWFTLKENTCYHMRFSIQVSNNIVSGLSYINTVWKTVDSSKQMLGIFSPQVVPYIYEMPEEIILYEMMNLTLSNVMSDRHNSTTYELHNDDDDDDIEIGEYNISNQENIVNSDDLPIERDVNCMDQLTEKDVFEMTFDSV